MYVSHLVIGPAAARALRLTDTYSIHRIVYDLFDDVRDAAHQEHSGMLFVDKGGDARGRKIVILSNRPPSKTCKGVLQTRELDAAYFDFDEYLFEIVVNPVRRSNATGRLVPVTGREGILAWFVGHTASWGFDADGVEVKDVYVDAFVKGKRTVTIGKAVIAGRLRVLDRHRFADAVANGIGRGRAFGCGLLQLLPFINK